MTEKNAIERRTIIKAAAWAAPVVAVAAATTPAFAATNVTVSYTTGSTLSGVSTSGVLGNITLSAANFQLTGPAGTTSGQTHILVTVPTGYTAQTLGGTPLIIGSILNTGWFVTRIEGNEVEIAGPPLTVPTGATSTSAWFEGILLAGSGASRPNNRAYFEYWSDENEGGTAYYPR